MALPDELRENLRRVKKKAASLEAKAEAGRRVPPGEVRDLLAVMVRVLWLAAHLDGDRASRRSGTHDDGVSPRP